MRKWPEHILHIVRNAFNMNDRPYKCITSVYKGIVAFRQFPTWPFINSHFVNINFYNSQFVNVDEMGICLLYQAGNIK